MMTTAIAVTGADGYLGSAVMPVLLGLGCPHAAVPGRLEHLPPGSLGCLAVVHCAGRLRGHSAQRIWLDNVTATATLLRAVPPTATFVLASSRAADSVAPDQYGLSKRQAECLAAAHSGSVCTVRLTVLVGPSPSGLGSSFLSQMTESAVRRGVITIPRQTRLVDLLDVREAAAVLAAMAKRPDECPATLHATSGAVDLFSLAELIAETALAVTGQRVTLVRDSIPDSHHPTPASREMWQELLARCGVAPIPLEATVRDTTLVQATIMESDHVHR
jgi:nucleoside-diphosphate-sugar epimerase